MNYTAQDIETLSFRDAVRERVAMYMGSADNQGVLHWSYSWQLTPLFMGLGIMSLVASFE